MTLHPLQTSIEQFFQYPQATSDPAVRPDAMAAFLALRTALEAGEVRAAEPDPSSATGWRVNAWVKRGILLGFRLGVLQETVSGALCFVDKDTYPVREFTAADEVRIVPGGSSVRAGAYLARSVVCM